MFADTTWFVLFCSNSSFLTSAGSRETRKHSMRVKETNLRPLGMSVMWRGSVCVFHLFKVIDGFNLEEASSAHKRGGVVNVDPPMSHARSSSSWELTRVVISMYLNVAVALKEFAGCTDSFNDQLGSHTCAFTKEAFKWGGGGTSWYRA